MDAELAGDSSIEGPDSVAPLAGEATLPPPTPEAEQFVVEEDKLYDKLEDSRFTYLLLDLQRRQFNRKDKTTPHIDYVQNLLQTDSLENKERKQFKDWVDSRVEYEMALMDLILHRCAYAVAHAGPNAETRTMGEHLLEIIVSAVNRDAAERHKQENLIRNKKVFYRAVALLDKHPKLRFGATMAIGTTLLVGGKVGLNFIPEEANLGLQYLGGTLNAVATGIGGFVRLSRRRRRQHMKETDAFYVKQESAMHDDRHATLRFGEMLGDYLSESHHDLFRDRILQATTKDELMQITDELEEAIEHHASHVDIRDIARMLKLYFDKILVDEGLLEELEEHPDEPDKHKKFIGQIVQRELDNEEGIRHDEPYRRLCTAVGAALSAAALSGDLLAGVHPPHLPDFKKIEDEDFDTDDYEPEVDEKPRPS